MHNSIKVPKIVYKTAVSFIALVFVSWVGWVSTGILEAGKESAKLETLQTDIDYIKKRIDDCYDTLIERSKGQPITDLLVGPPPPVTVHPAANQDGMESN